MRTITHSEFQAASGEPVYVSHVHYASPAERKAGDAAAQAVVVPAAFVPLAGLVGKGGQFDPEEPWPSDKDAETIEAPKKTHFDGIPLRLPDGQLNPAAISAVIRKVKADHMPPNCDFVSHGEALAQAQYEKAIDGEGCDSVACSITQGASS